MLGLGIVRRFSRVAALRNGSFALPINGCPPNLGLKVVNRLPKLAMINTSSFSHAPEDNEIECPRPQLRQV